MRSLLTFLIFLSPLLVIFFLFREKKFVERFATTSSFLAKYFVDKNESTTPLKVQNRLGGLLTLSIVTSAMAAVMVSQNCKTCPCKPIIWLSAHFACFLFGLIASGLTNEYRTLGCSLSALGIFFLVITLFSFATSNGIIPTVFLLPMLITEAGILQMSYLALDVLPKNEKSCNMSCSAEKPLV